MMRKVAEGGGGDGGGVVLGGTIPTLPLLRVMNYVGSILTRPQRFLWLVVMCDN